MLTQHQSEAIHAVEIIAGHNPRTINYAHNPGAIYTYPEIASGRCYRRGS